jgi:predicted Zn-dependent peptidase
MLMDVRETHLENGIRVVTSEIPRVESASVGIWVGVGARHERADLSGISHFIEHLLFKGTPKRSAAAISRAIEGRGGYLNAFTQEENTCYYARVPYNRLWSTVDVLVDMYKNASFDETEIEKEKNVIIEEIMMYRDQPQHVVQDNLSTVLWHNHPLGRSIIGSPEGIRAVGRETILAYRDSKYVTANTVIALAGKVKHDDCVEKLRKLTQDARSGRKVSARKATARVGQERLVKENRDIEQVHAAIGIRLFGYRDSRRYALKVLSGVLGENMSSRLFQRIRETHGLAYSIHSGTHLYRDTGALLIAGGLVRGKYKKALRLTINELAKLKNKNVSGAELRRAKDYAIGQLRLGMESTSHQMIRAGENLLSHGRFLQPEETISEIERVTADELRRLANEVLAPSRTSISLVGREIPDKDDEKIDQYLSMLDR